MQGKTDEHWAMRTDFLVGRLPKMEKELFMNFKPQWVPKLLRDVLSLSHVPGFDVAAAAQNRLIEKGNGAKRFDLSLTGDRDYLKILVSTNLA